jgi:hypothetical protein
VDFSNKLDNIQRQVAETNGRLRAVEVSDATGIEWRKGHGEMEARIENRLAVIEKAIAGIKCDYRSDK